VNVLRNLVVVRVGTGAAALSSAAQAVFLDEFDPLLGTRVRVTPLPTASSGGQRALTLSGTATSEGALSRSADGRYLVFGGYDAVPGTASIAGTSTSGATPVLRVFGRVDALGNVDTTTTTTSFSASNIRGAASLTGAEFWGVGASTGVVYAPFGGSGAGTVVASSPTTLRTLTIAGGQLYVSCSSGTTRVATVGTGTPTTSGAVITNLPGTPTSGSPNAFFLADLSPTVPGVDTAYVADDAAGLLKWTLSAGGTWSASGTAGLGPDTYRGVTGVVSGSSVILFATRKSSELVTLTDTSGYGGTFTAPVTTLATAANNTAFRGVALAPIP
jgi:hypothetical protein